MTRLQSYIDTTLRVIHINRQSSLPENTTEALRKLILQSETSRPLRHEFVSKHLEIEHRNNPEMLKVLSHEFHHYLQGLFYPFLYYISWLEMDNLLYLGVMLREEETEIIPIEKVHMSEDFFRNLNFAFQYGQFYWDNGNLLVRIPENNYIGNDSLTLNDLLEDATTIFEYRINVDDPTPTGFEDWVNNPENNCYKRTYRFLRKCWSIEKTFNLLPLAVQVAFSCTEPFTGFCTAVSYINFYLQDYHCYPIETLFQEIMIFLEHKIGRVIINPDEHKFISDIPVGVISYKDLQPVIEKSNLNKLSLHYPLSVHLVKLRDKILLNPDYQNNILKIDRDILNELLKEYYPFAIYYHFKDFDGRSGSMTMGMDFRDSNGPQGIPYSLYVKELIKLKETHLALFTRIHDHIDNNCHHDACSYYDLGLCKMWNSIPFDYEKCGFPYWFGHHFHRKIDLPTKSLVKISIEDVSEYFYEYERRSFQTRPFDFTLLKPGYLLTIDAKAIKESETQTMFSDFILFLKEQYNETSESLCSSITLDFYGYNKDSRELFQIPEVIKFIRTNKKQMPELLYYINFSSDANHKLMLLPMFIKHEVLKDKGNIFTKFEPNDFGNFALQEGKIWHDFILKNKIKNTDLVFNNLYKIFT